MTRAVYEGVRVTAESWKLEGNFHDDVDFEIKESWFGVRENDDRKKVALHLRGVAVEDGEVVDDEYTLSFNVGEGWEATKNGAAVKHVAGKTQFRKNTSIGRLIQAVAGIEEAFEVMVGRGDAREAATWVGIIMHWEVMQGTFTDRETKEVSKYDYTVPTAFVGESGGAAKTPAKTRGRAVVKEEATDDSEAEAPKRGRGRPPKAEAEEVAGETPAPRTRGRARAAKPAGNEKLRAAVVEFAGQFDEHDFFLEQVLDAAEFAQADELTEDEELMAEVMDPTGDLWTSTR